MYAVAVFLLNFGIIKDFYFYKKMKYANYFFKVHILIFKFVFLYNS